MLAKTLSFDSGFLTHRPLAWLVAACLPLGCSGNIDAPQGGASSTPPGIPATGDPVAGDPVAGDPVTGDPVTATPSTDGAGGGTTEVGACGDATQPGAAPVRRLNRFEYNNTVRDLLGDTSQPAAEFPAEERMAGFDNNAAALTVSPVLTESYFTAAERLATNAVESNLAALTPNPACDLTQDDSACARRFLEQFGERAYRGPLTQEELTVLQGVYDQGNASGGPSNGVKLVVATVLMSPRFLYRVELDAAPANGEVARRLDSWEVASRLSYLVWGSMPDDLLLEAARSGQLSTDEQIAAQAERMLNDTSKSAAVIKNFHEQWLGLYSLDTVSKDQSVYRTWDPSLLALMKQETMRFVEHVIFEAGGTLTELLTAPYTFANATLADHYGVASAAPGDALTQVALDPSRRAGLLTQGSLMTLFAHADQSSPIRRGTFVREHILCEELVAPPDDVDITLPELSEDLTTRERFEQHRSDPACAGCHTLIDPIGLGFENLDGVGKWRDTENGLPVDAAGEVVGMADGAFVGPVQLATKLAASEQVQGCAVEKWFTYSYGRAPVDGQDDCTLHSLESAFKDGGTSVRALILALTKTDIFRYRRVGDTL